MPLGISDSTQVLLVFKTKMGCKKYNFLHNVIFTVYMPLIIHKYKLFMINLSIMKC